MQLVHAYEQMAAAAEKGDAGGVYDAIFSFAAVGLETVENPVLARILQGLMPNAQRLQYLSLVVDRKRYLAKLSYFKTIVESLEARDVERGVQAMEAYVASEKAYALASFGASSASSASRLR